jgi:hypothetical protein
MFDMNSVLTFLMLVLLGGIGCYFIIASFGSVFLGVLVIILCLVSRDICCCGFELIFVPSAEYQSGVHSFLSAGVWYQSSLL